MNPIAPRPIGAKSNLCADCRASWCARCRLYGGRHNPAFHQPPPERFERRDRVTLADVAGLYVDAYPDALRIARRVLGAAEADDVVHAAIVVMLRRRHTFTHASLQYFLTVTKNLAHDWRGQRGRIDYVPEEALILLDAQRQRDVRGHRVAPPPRRHDGTPSG